MLMRTLLKETLSSFSNKVFNNNNCGDHELLGGWRTLPYEYGTSEIHLTERPLTCVQDSCLYDL